MVERKFNDVIILNTEKRYGLLAGETIIKKGSGILSEPPFNYTAFDMLQEHSLSFFAYNL